MKATFLRVIYFAIPAVLLAVIILAMNAGPILKRPMGPEEDMPAIMQEVVTLAAAGRWLEARAAAERLELAWERIRGRVAFASEAPDLHAIELGLAELRGALDGEDVVQVQIIQRRLLALWELLGG